MAVGLGLIGVEKGDVIEMMLEILDELRGKGDFGDEKDDGSAIF